MMTEASAPDHLSDDMIQHHKNDLSGVLSILSFGKNHKKPLFASVFILILSSVLTLASARILGVVAELLTTGRSEGVWAWTFAFVVLEAIAVFLVYRGRILLSYTTNQIVYEVRCLLFDKLGKLPMSYFDMQPLGRTITRLTTDVSGVERLFAQTLSTLVAAIITITIVFIGLMVLDFKFGVLVCLSALPSLTLNLFLKQKVRYWMRAFKKRNSKSNSVLTEMLSGLEVIKILHLEEWSQKIYSNAVFHHLKASISLMHWNSIARPLTVMLCLLPTLVVLYWGGLSVLQGGMQLGIFVAFVRYSESFLGPVRSISQEIQQIQDALASSERINQMLREDEEDDAFGKDGERSELLQGTIEFKDVRMSYSNGKEVLKGVSFKAETGMQVGLVGETGSGKSSTINLIPSLYPFQSGEILLDGISIKELRRYAVREQLGMVSQDVVTFKGTLRDNLLAAHQSHETIGDQELMKACRRTGLATIMDAMPNGLDSHIYEGGSNLSMGERQLIAFTRMLIRDPRILILDEATANIDHKYERLIQNAVANVMKGRTCFIIAHRLSTIVNCDLILVFNNGEIVEQGTHAELLKQSGYYAELVQSQV